MRTLNDITPPSRRKESEPSGSSHYPARDILRIPERPSRFPYMTLGIALLVIVGSIGALFYFSSATVTVIPKTVSAAVQSAFTAEQSSGVLAYEVITAQKIATRSVKGSGTKTMTTSASGTITIYNTQTKAQPLVANTRFASPAGLIFRIRSAVTVPGGSEQKPGSVTAKVYADQPGSTYNVGPTSFTVPGFAGTPQAKAVYARSQAAMTGGASGTVPVVDADAEAGARRDLIKALEPDLLAAISGKVPSGYVLVAGAASTTYESLALAPAETTGQVDVREQGTITAVVFPNAALAKAVAGSITGLSYQGEPVTLAPESALTLSSADFPDGSGGSFSFALNGTASLVYTVDPTRIAAAIAGKTRSAAEVALSNFTEVKKAILVLRPFWRNSFPQDPTAITVRIEGGETP